MRKRMSGLVGFMPTEGTLTTNNHLTRRQPNKLLLPHSRSNTPILPLIHPTEEQDRVSSASTLTAFKAAVWVKSTNYTFFKNYKNVFSNAFKHHSHWPLTSNPVTSHHSHWPPTFDPTTSHHSHWPLSWSCDVPWRPSWRQVAATSSSPPRPMVDKNFGRESTWKRHDKRFAISCTYHLPGRVRLVPWHHSGVSLWQAQNESSNMLLKVYVITCF